MPRFEFAWEKLSPLLASPLHSLPTENPRGLGLDEGIFAMSLTFDAASWSPPDQDAAQASGGDGRRSARELGETDDQHLMALIGAGDRAAFTVFCRRHTARCLSVAFHLLRDTGDAEEAVQDAFLRVWLNAGRWRNTEARVTTWLFRVVVNRALDQMRRASRQGVSLEHAADLAAIDPDPEAAAGARELAAVIARAMDALPPRQRAALSLVINRGLGCTEAARAMDVSVGTMESLLTRGRRQIREAIAVAERTVHASGPRREKDSQEIGRASV